MEKKDIISYAIKVFVLYIILFCLNLTSYKFTPIIVIISCILLCIPNAAALVYLVVVNKTVRARHYQDGGWLQKINNGKILSIIILFFISLISTFAMFLEIPTWQLYEWIAIIVLLPVYFIVFKLTRALLKKEVKGFYLDSYNLKWCSIIVPIIMSILYFAVSYFFIPKTEYRSILDAFIDQGNKLGSSPSALTADMATLTSLFNAFYYYAISRFSGSFPIITVFWNVLIYWAVFFNITNILNCFMIPPAQLKRIFIPLTTEEIPNPETKVQKKYIFLPVTLVIISIFSFLLLDNRIAAMNQAGHFTRIETFVRDKMQVLVAVIDDQYYRYQPVMELARQVKFDTSNLLEQAHNEIVPLVNHSFDARIANVDSYLDWYYSLSADYLRLINLAIGSIESYMEGKLTEYIDAGVDDTKWLAKMDYYSYLAEQLDYNYKRELEKYRIDQFVPEWLIQPQTIMSMSAFTASFEPTRKLMDYKTRLGISAVVGAGAGIITKILITKLIQKQFFQGLIKRVIAALTAKTAAKVATTVATSTGTGALAGSATLNPAGTVVGAVVGAIAGIAIAIGTDYLLINIDEKINREKFRDEIIQTIEQQRQEVLGLL